MKIKKLASAVLSAILGTVIIFSGCSNGGSVNDNSSKTESSAPTSVAESKTESSKTSKAESSTVSTLHRTVQKICRTMYRKPLMNVTISLWSLTQTV